MMFPIQLACLTMLDRCCCRCYCWSPAIASLAPLQSLENVVLGFPIGPHRQSLVCVALFRVGQARKRGEHATLVGQLFLFASIRFGFPFGPSTWAPLLILVVVVANY